jgi:hypothetical protein
MGDIRVVAGRRRVTLTVAALSTSTRLALIIAAGAVAWLAAAGVVAGYGKGRGYAFTPLFICALFLGFPIVLLGVVVGEGPRTRER